MDSILANLRGEIARQPSTMRIPILSFFTGGGFLDLGFEQAGFEIIWTNEVNDVFADMYEYGITSFRQSKSSNARAAKISDRRSITEISTEDIFDAVHIQRNQDFFGIIGGPPCPDFCNGGKHLGSKGNKGRLSKSFIDKICEIEPDFFVFENVPGLIRFAKHRRYLARLEGQLERDGYAIDMRILNALELGWPQDRERLVLIGMKRNILEGFTGRFPSKFKQGWFPWPEYPEYSGAKKRFNWPTVEPIGKEPEKPKGIPDRLMVNCILGSDYPPVEQPNGLEAFKPYSAKFYTTCEGDIKGKSFKRLHRYRYSPTACYGHNEIHLHPWESRRLTVREAMRIQGIPDTYILPSKMPLTAKFAMIGNGVPVPLARSVANALYQYLLKIID